MHQKSNYFKFNDRLEPVIHKKTEKLRNICPRFLASWSQLKKKYFTTRFASSLESTESTEALRVFFTRSTSVDSVDFRNF